MAPLADPPRSPILQRLFCFLSLPPQPRGCSLSQAEFIARLSGTRPLPGSMVPSPVWDRALGHLGGIQLSSIAGKDYLVLQPGPLHPPCCTVLCCAATPPAAAELERSVQAGVRLLTQAVMDSTVVPGERCCGVWCLPFPESWHVTTASLSPGGGFPEATLARIVRQRSAEVLESSAGAAPPHPALSPRAAGHAALADALEHLALSCWAGCGGTTADGGAVAGTPRSLALSQVLPRFSASAGPGPTQFLCWGCVAPADASQEVFRPVCRASYRSDLEEDGPPSWFAEGPCELLELAAAKRAALARAVEAATTLLRIDGSVADEKRGL